MLTQERLLDLLQLVLPADQRRRLWGQVGRAVVDRLQRRKLTFEPWSEKLVEPLRCCQVLQSILAQVTDSQLAVDLVGQQVPGCL